MLFCKNDKKKKYKGTEPSPKGLGYCAHAEKEGKKRKGKDGNTWIVTKVSNGSLRWMKIKKDLTKDQKKTLLKIKTELKKELKKLNVKLFVVRNKIYNGIYFTDHPWDVVDEKINNFDNEKFLIVPLKINYDNEIVLDKGGLYIQHHNIKHTVKKDIMVLLKKMFGRNYKWDGKQSSAIFIKL